MKKFLNHVVRLLAFSVLIFGAVSCKAKVEYVEVPVEKEVQVEVEKKVYTCPVCGKGYNSAKKAKECCGVQYEQIYTCPGCENEYDTAEEAAACYASHQPVADTTAPSAVTSLTAINLDNAVALKWTDPTASDLFGIEITWTPQTVNASRAVAAMEANSLFVAPGKEIAEISNLKNGVEYTFTVKAMDTSGNKSDAETVTITPEEIECGALAITLTPDTTDGTNQDYDVAVVVSTKEGRSVKTVKYAAGVKDLAYFETNGTVCDSSFTVSENNVYTVFVQDIDGRVGLKSIVIDNIDKDPPAAVTGLSAMYNYTEKKVTLNWVNPAVSDLDYCVVYATFGGAVVADNVKVNAPASSCTITGVEADNSKEFAATVTAVDKLGNQSPVANTSTVPMEGAYVSSLVVDKYHVSGTAAAADRTINVTAVISNKDLLTGATPVKILLCDENDSSVANSTTYDAATGTATATFVVPEKTSATRDGVNYTVKIKLDGTTDKTTARINVSKAPELSYTQGERDYYGDTSTWRPNNYLLTKDSEASELSVNKIQKASADLSSSSKIDVQLKGYNLDVSPVVLQYYTLSDAAYGDPIVVDTSAFAWTAAEGDHEEKTVNFTIPYPQDEGIYRLKILIEGTVFKANYQTNWEEQGQSDYYFNKIDVYNTIQVYGNPKFTSFKIPKAGIAKEDSKLEATIIGANFIAPGVTADSFSIGCANNSVKDGATVTVVDDNTLTVRLNIPGTVGVYPVTVTAGTESISADFDVRNKYNIGDVILNDGTTVIAVDNVATYFDSDEKKASAVGVIGLIKPESGVPLILGKYNSSNEDKKYTWAPETSTSFYTQFPAIEIKSNKDEDLIADTDGSDNWSYVCSIDPEGTKDAATNYPAFNYANNYGTTYSLSQEMKDDWYLPTAYELKNIILNKDVVSQSLTAIGGSSILLKYWTSSTIYVFFNTGSEYPRAYYVWVNGKVYADSTDNDYAGAYSCAVKIAK